MERYPRDVVTQRAPARRTRTTDRSTATDGRSRPRRQEERSIGDPAERRLLLDACEEAARLLRCDGALTYLVDDTGMLRFAVGAGIVDRHAGRVIRDLRLPPGVGMFGRALAERRVVSTGDYEHDPSFTHTSGADIVVSEVGMRSMVSAPLIAGETILGAMGVYADMLDAFSPADVALVKSLAEHAATAIVNRRLIADLAASQEQLRRRAEAERALRELAARISAIRDPAELLQQVVDEAARLLDADGARIDLLDPKDGVLYWAYDAMTGLRPGMGPIEGDGEAQAGEGISGRAVLERRAVYTGDYLVDDRFVHAAMPDAHAERYTLRSVLAAPLLGDADPFGTLTVYSSKPDAFGSEDAALIEALANQAGVAIRNAHLFEELARSREESARRADVERTLREIGARITAVRDPREILHQIAGEAARLLGHERVFINLLDPGVSETGWTWYSPSEVGRDEWTVDEAVGIGEGLTGKAILERRPVWTGDYLNDPSFIHRPGPDRYTEETGMISSLAAPMYDGDDPLGAMLVETDSPDAFDERDARILEALAQQAASALSNARLIEALGESREETAYRADAERSLREIAGRITAIRDPDALLQGVLDEAARLLWAERAQIDLVDPVGDRAQWTFPPDSPGSRSPGGIPKTGIGAGAIASGRGVWTGDYLRDRSFRHARQTDRFIRSTGIRSVVASPLVTDAGLVGVIQVGTSRPDAYGADDADRLAGLASQAAVALTTARLLEELATSREELAERAEAERRLREIAARITSVRDSQEILHRIVLEAQRLLGTDRAAVSLVVNDPAPRMQTLFAVDDEGATTGDDGRNDSVRYGRGVSGRAMETGRPFWTGDYLKDRSFSHHRESDRYVRRVGVRSVLAAPLVDADETFGALLVESYRKSAFDEASAQRLSSLALQASIAIANARLFAALEQSRQEIARRAEAEQTLRQIAAEVTSLRDPRDVVHLVIRAATKLLDGDVAELGLAADADPIYAFVGASSLPGTDGTSPPTVISGVGISGLAYTTRAVVRTGDYTADRRFEHGAGVDAFLERHGLRSAISAPLTSEGRAFGAMTVISRRPDAFEVDDEPLLQALADQASIAIENTRLITQLERSREELARRVETERSLRDIAARITALHEPRAVLDSIVEESRRLLDSDGAHLTFMADDHSHLTPAVLMGASDDATEAWMLSLKFPLHGGINGLAAARREVVWTEDYLTDPRIPHEPDDQDVAGRLGIRGMAAAPLRSLGGEVIGTLAISYREPRIIAPDELDLLQGLADHAAIALANSRLLERVGASEERYRFLVENAPDIVFATDAEGVFTYVSESIERLLGWPVEEVVGRHFSLLVDESSIPGALERWAELTQDPAIQATQRLMLIHTDSRRIPYEVRAVGAWRDGAFDGIHGASRDMSERDQLERSLRESELRYRYLVKASPDVVWAVDVDGLITFMSDRLEELTGWTPEEVAGRHFRFLAVEESVARAEEIWGRSRPTRQASTRCRSRCRARARTRSRSRSGRPAWSATANSPGPTARSATCVSASVWSAIFGARRPIWRRARSGPTWPASCTTRSPRRCSR